ncbi:MAG: hypothetical protein JWO53_1256, partial [Chlamydiia bacterium]|nr:hypothetical protein [Chlamydiia bacterium]
FSRPVTVKKFTKEEEALYIVAQELATTCKKIDSTCKNIKQVMALKVEARKEQERNLASSFLSQLIASLQSLQLDYLLNPAKKEELSPEVIKLFTENTPALFADHVKKGEIEEIGKKIRAAREFVEKMDGTLEMIQKKMQQQVRKGEEIQNQLLAVRCLKQLLETIYRSLRSVDEYIRESHAESSSEFVYNVLSSVLRLPARQQSVSQKEHEVSQAISTLSSHCQVLLVTCGKLEESCSHALQGSEDAIVLPNLEIKQKSV